MVFTVLALKLSVIRKKYMFKGARNCSSLASKTIAHAVRGEHCVGTTVCCYQNLVILKKSEKSSCVDIAL